MSRIFLSHSSVNNAEAVALHDWLSREGWKGEIFLDLDPTSGIAPGERWERKLNEAANRCEAVLFLVSKAWLASGWCRKELGLAHRLNKRLFGVLIEDLPVADIPNDLSGEWQLVQLASGRDHVMLHAVIPITQQEVHVTFSAEGMQRLKHGLEQAGLDPKYFVWPPASEPDRPPYRGLKPLEADDAGIFFGRDAPIVEALDQLRGLCESTPPRLMVILGASGAGKSSFMRAGVLPRLKRDDRHFLPLPIIRPDRAAISGENGFLRSLQVAFQDAKILTTRADLRKAIDGGAVTLRPLLQLLVDKGIPTVLDQEPIPKTPELIIPIDQGEELFLAEGRDEAGVLLGLLRDILTEDAPSIVILFTIRSDAYERLQLAKELEGIRHIMLNLPPMPRGSYAEVIKGPAIRLQGANRPLTIEESLVNSLLVDIDQGGAKDALPLLAFTLERLYVEYGDRGQLKLADYQALGGIKGSIEAAVERAFAEADKNPAVPKDRNSRLALLRRGLIPWLAGIDPDTGSPRRRVARKSEIPEEARPLIEHLIEQRLLATDISKETGEQTIEPVHEALLRQWGLLQGWLEEDIGFLSMMGGIKRAARDWAANGMSNAWLTHAGRRLRDAERLGRERVDLVAYFEQTDRDYLSRCRHHERTAQLRTVGSAMALAGILVLTTLALVEREYLKLYWSMWTGPTTLTAAEERALTPMQGFRECAECPMMVVVPAGEFIIGSPFAERGRISDEVAQQVVKIDKSIAVSKFEVTFKEWDACVALGGCDFRPDYENWGRGIRPVINVSWNDAKQYVAWINKQTGKNYRLLSEAEWEYAARAGSATAYWWGDVIRRDGNAMANCDGCGSQWDHKQTAPVGSFAPNFFGLHDMLGNVWEWVENCWDAVEGYCRYHVLRGGSWLSQPSAIRNASRLKFPVGGRSDDLGFRVARTLQ